MSFVSFVSLCLCGEIAFHPNPIPYRGADFDMPNAERYTLS